MISFTVIGKAEPAGSKKAAPIFKNGPNGKELVRRQNGSIMTTVRDDNDKSKPWQQQVAGCAMQAYGNRPVMLGPIRLTVTFYRARSKGDYGSGKNSHLVKASSPRFPTTKPDATKLLRGIEDACTGILWRDDAQIVDQHIYKRFGEPARAEITVEEINTGDQP